MSFLFEDLNVLEFIFVFYFSFLLNNVVYKICSGVFKLKKCLFKNCSDDIFSYVTILFTAIYVLISNIRIFLSLSECLTNFIEN